VAQPPIDAGTAEQAAPSWRSITVLIPTYKRPDFLRNALDSVLNQSRLDLIAEVVVSENSDDPRSEFVCREFPQLPLKFIRQSPPVGVGHHFAFLPTLANTPLVALLGDDDMWGRYHLEEAARLLANEPAAVACINMAVNVPNSARGIAGTHSTLLQTKVAPWADRFADHWTWSAKDVLLASLFWTPLNMWSFVGRRTVMIEAMKVFTDPDQGTDSDRFMIWRIAKAGPVVIGREVGLFYRIHPDNACSRMESKAPDFHKRSWRRNLELMLDEAAEMGIDAKKEWQKTFGDADLPAIFMSQYPMTIECRNTLLQRWGPVRQLCGADSKPSGFLKTIAREVLPPFVQRGARSLLERIRRDGK
jgi:glycosyltransferase involved in cell wall biosynthesis